MNPTLAMCLASLVLTGLAIVSVNSLPTASHIRGSPVHEIPMLVYLGVYAVGALLFGLDEKGGPKGYWLPAITVFVMVSAFVLGTARVD